MQALLRLSVVTLLLLAFCPTLVASDEPAKETTLGFVERLDPRLDALIPKDAVIEVLAEGFEWSEGPLWVPEGDGFLLFSDVPKNIIYRYAAGETTVWLEPSGYTGKEPRGGEPGSNGLTLNLDGHLVLCQHGDRRVARMDAPWNAPEPNFTTLADRHDGHRFHSPNDLTFDSAGNLYFTDPPLRPRRRPRRPRPRDGLPRRLPSRHRRHRHPAHPRTHPPQRHRPLP